MVLPYRRLDALNPSDEELELELRYRKNHAFAIGHGTAVAWEAGGNSATSVRTDVLPIHRVAAVSARESQLPILTLKRIVDIDHDPAVMDELIDFISTYSEWIRGQVAATDELTNRHTEAAGSIVGRQIEARDRMLESVDQLRADKSLRVVLSIAMRAMREQMLQTRFIETVPDTVQRPVGFDTENEPRFRMFQLAFVLVALPSTVDSRHQDRALVDLIWFPTGGGKTEAYLALAAIEIVHRRLTQATQGGGTAVLTRYTLRLLTTQQFQRAATLICALELMRMKSGLLPGTSRFSIGLWVGNDTTPGNEDDAIALARKLPGHPDPHNPFQLDVCPWCNTKIIPRGGSDDVHDFGFKILGKSIVLRCPEPSCDFSDQLPVEVVDSRIFEFPPTFVLATVDKFARIPFIEQAGALLGTGSYAPPGLVIQDELHLLSGQLGTTVGLFDSAVFGIMEMHGGCPKVVASTATIRAAQEQVSQLMSRKNSIFPPAGISEDDSFFAVPSPDKPGRTFIGLMPQAFTQATSIVRAAAAFLNAPLHADFNDAEIDAYWTLVAYHNSLRELGRTAVLLRDDVPGLLANKRNLGDRERLLDVSRNVELTGRANASDLPAALDRLKRSYPDEEAIDTVVSTNMLSVGIDIARLAAMIMNGLPKTTSEYIQATSRVGRSSVPGIILTYFRPGRSRDRSIYENFHGYHQALYRYVEPTSVTPWSTASRKRTLPAALAALVRHGAQLDANGDAYDFNYHDWYVDEIKDLLRSRVQIADSRETEHVENQVERLFREWSHRVDDEDEFEYFAGADTVPSLLKNFGENKDGWAAANSMRTVDDEVRIRARFEKDED
ncbi:helicase-related protein [Brevibacterium aurantiacum]|uniref:helicase-related protein n=1 Tax=Brevibacterium aurantiacum TaxID=273384 RepID=UPI0011C05E9B|nr:helicase-related protein [Brevibacterium aurantiacum]